MSNLFAPYMEKIRFRVGGRYKELQTKAYRMDGTTPGKNMRSPARLGTISCCDYLYISDEENFSLIEDTQMGKKTWALLEEYQSLNESSRLEYIKERIRREISLKVYGSMLMLCRLCKDGPNRCMFWLVINDADMNDGRFAKFLRGTRYGLKRDIELALMGPKDGSSTIEGGLRGANLASKVNILTLSKFCAQWEGRADTQPYYQNHN